MECNETGYKGLDLFELLVMSEPIRELISMRAPAGCTSRPRAGVGNEDVAEDGIRSILDGETTVEGTQSTHNSADAHRAVSEAWRMVMPKFSYVALDTRGRKLPGVLESENTTTAVVAFAKWVTSPRTSPRLTRHPQEGRKRQVPLAPSRCQEGLLHQP